MYYYKYDNTILVSKTEYTGLHAVTEQEAAASESSVCLLNELDPLFSRARYQVSVPGMAFAVSEGIDMLKISNKDSALPQWLLNRIHEGKVSSINTGYPKWQELLSHKPPKKWRINVVGLGDVGGILVAGLRLLGGEHIDSVGIYDIDVNKVNRWLFEANQIASPDSGYSMPKVLPLTEDKLFDCDMFVFCVTVGVPPLGETKDVRIVQFEGNSKIISIYAKKARANSFKGIFAVVSDPVDLLCKSAFLTSNTAESGELDFGGLAADQIRGYGLGVMHARALYYSGENRAAAHYPIQGRAFGPHGEGLVIADSISNYDNELSLWLTDKARKANLQVRDTGFKPYIAPALSSGALSLIATISGQWHYSATYMGGVYWGSRNRLLPTGIEIEQYELPELLFSRIKESYEGLGKII